MVRWRERERETERGQKGKEEEGSQKSGNGQKEGGWKAWYEAAALLESWRGRRVFLRAEGEGRRRQVARSRGR